MLALTQRPHACCPSMGARYRSRRMPVDRAVMCSAARPTPQQVLRGHGAGGWKDAGYDLQSDTRVDGLLRDLILTYGELTQATYDRLGLDPCDSATYGTTVVKPPEMLKYLDQDYPLAPDEIPNGRPAARDLYRLPAKEGMSPLLYALPGKLVPGQSVVKPPERKPWVIGIVDTVFATASQAVAQLIDSNNGGRTLIRELTPDGRGKVARGAFIGYVAVSQPIGPEQEVDVAIVWRGTIFREEWESNFVQDRLDEWAEDADCRAMALCPPDTCACFPPRAAVTPDPADVGVHDGFQDLYDRPIVQAWPMPKDDTGACMSPRQAVHAWLVDLLRDYNVTTITTTGHSLGGGLSTLCAYDVGCWLQKQWKDGQSPFKVTKAMPKVTCISFAAPRVGNAAFVEHFKGLGIKALRVVNKGDQVPELPGFVVQVVMSGLRGVSRILPWPVNPKDLLDMYSWPISSCRTAYKQFCIFCARLNSDWRSRWGFWHVGQVLPLDVARVDGGLLRDGLGKGNMHNLELHLYLVSLASNVGTTPGTDRNPILLNKSSDLLAYDKKIPAYWWDAPDKRCCSRVNGRWEGPMTIDGK